MKEAAPTKDVSFPWFSSYILKVLFIFFFALSLRLYMVDSVPLGVRNDEASFGYNAYSILETGKDEHGEKYPLIFKAFGDQKLPAYMYSIVPAVKIFGLNNLAVRLPSVLAGTFSALIFYCIVLRFAYIRRYAFLAALLFAASPWSIILSRSAYESNLGLMFFLGGLYFLIRSIKDRDRNSAIVTGVLFGLSWYSYIAYRLVTVLLLVLTYLYTSVKNRSFKKNQLILPMIALLITVIPLFPSLLSQQGTARFEQVGLLSDDGPVMEIIEARTFCMDHFPRILCYADSNKLLVYGRNMLNSFVQTISPEYLFINGDDHTAYLDAEHFGNLHYYLLPFYILGLAIMLRRIFVHQHERAELIILCGFLISTLPAVLTHGPHLVRISSLLPFLILITVFGIAFTEDLIKKTPWTRLYQTFHIFTAIAFGFIFLFNYVGISIPKNDVSFLSHTYRLVEYLDTLPHDKPVYVYKIPEIVTFYAYVNSVSPESYHKLAKYPAADVQGFSHANSYLNIHYSEKNHDELICTTKDTHALFVAHEGLDATVKPVKIIYSSSKVHKMYYIYDLFSLPQPNCDEFKK